jgi:hypothetical protein
MRRPDYPVFDLPHVPPDPWSGVSFYVLIAVSLATYAIAAANLLGPVECATQALTPECWSAIGASW